MAFNKGEWSEIYVFLKLLADGKIYAADSNLEKIKSVYFPILKILRSESIGEYEYRLEEAIKVIDGSGNLLLSIPICEFKDKSLFLLECIKNISSPSSEMREIESFLNSIYIAKLKSKSQDKRDITIVVHDMFTGENPELGFSIKSYLGSDPTIVNSSKATNFIFTIEQATFSQSEINLINNINTKAKIRDRIKAIENSGGKLKYFKLENVTFQNNLTIIDSMLPNILGEMLKSYYKGEASKVSDLISIIKQNNPCNYDLTDKHPFYEYKIKNYLTDSALGLKPAKLWSGLYDATGGYIVVKESGELVCYHMYNKNEMQEYLYKNTRFETPSSSKHDFGYLYTEDEKVYFKLNLQIRFI